MAFLLTHFWPGGTEEQYRATLAAVHPANGLPDGQLYHAAGATEGGYLITVVWDSKESSDRFVRDVLIASMPVEGGFEGKPDERGAEVSNLETAQ
jgi:heme-degrading monooxygenase HmoA